MGSDVAVIDLGQGTWQIDLAFLGHPGVIAAYLLSDGDHLTLVETGPTTTLPTLLAGIRAAGFDPADLREVLLTHIHLDHAGACGALLDQAPQATVGVHPIGAPHLVDPSRLLNSAGRIYGEDMERLWGEVRPTPEERVQVLEDGQTLSVAGRVITAIHTPGHASHHIAYWDAANGDLFTGDVGGIRMTGNDYVNAPAPPPDLDPANWRVSLEKMRDLQPRRLMLAHFGMYEDAASHLGKIIPELEAFLEIGRVSLAAGEDQAALTARLHKRMAQQMGEVEPALLTAIELATPSYMAAMGLTRYWTKQAPQASQSPGSAG